MGADVGLFGKFAKAGETQARQKRGGGQFLGSPEPLPSGCNQWDYRPSFATNRAPTLPRNGAGRAAFFSGVVRVLPRAALLRVSLLFVVALTGIEPTGCQFSPVHLSLSVCKHVQVVSPGCSGMRYESATFVTRLSLAGAKHAPKNRIANLSSFRDSPVAKRLGATRDALSQTTTVCAQLPSSR